MPRGMGRERSRKGSCEQERAPQPRHTIDDLLSPRKMESTNVHGSSAPPAAAHPAAHATAHPAAVLSSSPPPQRPGA
eukprot:5227440-Prymnesium_polylepis.1